MSVEEAILLFSRYVYGKDIKKDELVDIVDVIISAYTQEKEKNKELQNEILKISDQKQLSERNDYR